MLPASKAIPKVMLPLVDKPAIQYVVEEAVAAGIEQVILVTAAGQHEIEDHFDRAFLLEQALEQRGKLEELEAVRALYRMVEVVAVRQHAPRGIGDAVLTARGVVGDEPFAVFLPDDIIDADPPAIRQLMDVHERHGGAVVAVMPVPKEEVSRYGVVEGQPVGERRQRLRRLVEKPPIEAAPSNLAIVGRYVLPPEIFDIIAKLPPGAGGEIQLTDAINILAGEGPVFSCQFTGTRYDVGDKAGYLMASLDLALKRPDIRPKLLAYLRGLAWEQ